MSKTKLSIIIPVYNTEDYIKRCVDSVINQCYKDCEIIIVNDLSTDNSEAVIEDIIASNPQSNINYIPLDENAGVSNARNVGLSKAKGKYVSFIDSDDWVDSNFYSSMLQELDDDERNDIAVCNITGEHNNMQSAYPRYEYDEKNVITGEYALSLLSRVYNNNIFISPMVGNKVFRRNFLEDNELKFELISSGEDNVFMFIGFTLADQVVLVPDTSYHYYQRDGSLMHNFSKRRIDDLIDAFVIIKNILLVNGQYDKFVQEYRAFFEKCTHSTFNSLFELEKDVDNQRMYITYFMERFLSNFAIKNYVEYLDTNRFKEFLNIV